MWTSINMKVCLVVTGHYIDKNHKLHTSVLGVQHFSQNNKAVNIAHVKKDLVDNWSSYPPTIVLFLCPPASSVSCERLFSKARELVTK